MWNRYLPNQNVISRIGQSSQNHGRRRRNENQASEDLSGKREKRQVGEEKSKCYLGWRIAIWSNWRLRRRGQLFRLNFIGHGEIIRSVPGSWSRPPSIGPQAVASTNMLANGRLESVITGQVYKLRED